MLGSEWYITVCGISLGILTISRKRLFFFFFPRKGSAKDWGICTFLQVGEQEGFHRTLEAFTVEKARIHSGKHFTSQSTALQKAKIFLPPPPALLKSPHSDNIVRGWLHSNDY